VTSGLKDGERIVLAGVHTLYAGEPVTPTAPLFAAEHDTSPASVTR
jgi:multidrug efflux system membrane fusion protein